MVVKALTVFHFSVPNHKVENSRKESFLHAVMKSLCYFRASPGAFSTEIHTKCPFKTYAVSL